MPTTAEKPVLVEKEKKRGPEVLCESIWGSNQMKKASQRRQHVKPAQTLKGRARKLVPILLSRPTGEYRKVLIHIINTYWYQY